ncbi:MAG TPA: lamin tail domain-containing protein [Blastocatellia bacterium]|nr:lamin tail domain-containing protein [Blastocatellia bacterium]
MPRKRVISVLCIFILAPGLLFSVLASRKSQNPAHDAPLTPQTVTLIINEYLADPAGSAAGDLAGDANGDGTRDSADDEFVEIVNNGAASLNIGLFTISDATQVRFTIPAGKVIPPGESAVVFGGGTPTGAFGNAAANGLVFTAGSGGLSLNNGGDTITIKDNLAVTVTSVSYGSSEGSANQSITRSPDITGGFTTHSTATGSGGSLFSPGARVNGAPFTTTDPVISSISPEGAIAGGDPVSMTVTGVNFVGGSTVRVDGTPVSTAFFSAMEIVAEIPLSVTNAAGTYLITVQNPGGAISNAVPFTVLGEIGINEYLADPPDGPSGDANGDGSRDSAQDEFVEIVNRTGAPIDVGGFTVRDADAQRFMFPLGTSIPAGEAAVIFGGGSPQGEFGNARANGLVFTASLSLNNTGDTITLKNSSAVTVESVTYGSTEGNANQSINRNPDVSGIAFAPHSDISGSGGRLFSPGTLVNGSPFSLGPRITSIAPDNAKKGALPFDMNVLGSGFEGGSRVLIDGQVVTTEFIGPSHLVARVPASVTATSGSHPVQVRNEGGNRSNSVSLAIIPPPPALFSITPRVVIVGSGAFTMFVTGLNFGSGIVALFDGTPLPTTVTSAQDLRVSVPSTVTAAIGTHQVVVRNSDGQQSTPAILEVIAPATVVTSISPATAVVGRPGFTLVVKGSNFKNSASVMFDETALVTTFKSATELSAQAPAAAISTIGVHRVSVQNANEPASNDAAFQVFPEAPLIASLDPASVIEGSGDVTITITGEKFQPGAMVRVIELTDRGAPLDTTFVSSERLQAKIPAALTQTPGTVVLGVENPDLGLSNSVTLKVLIKDPLVINEYLADPPDTLAGDANGDGTRSASADEFIEILNRSGEPFDFSGYKISDADAVRHVFAAGTIVPPFEAVVVFGGGTPTGSFGNAAENHMVFRASTGGLSLNNGGDTISLQDAQGHVVQQIKFGAAEGGASQSINRDPDGDGATFTLHTIVAADGSRLFSPGAKAAGQTFTIKPIVRSSTPPTVHVGSIQFTLTVFGSKFLPGAVVLLGPTPLLTIFRSDTQLEAQVAATLVVEGGEVDVRVKNPRGELSGTVRLLIVDDPPRVSRITPQTAGTGAENLEVSVAGERFQRGAGVRVEGQVVETRFVSSTSLVAIVPSSLFARAAELPLIVLNADGNASNAVTLTVENGPLITRLSRGKIKAGSGVFELTVAGVAFKPGVILFANDAALSTTYGSDVSFAARIPAEMTNQPGVLTLQARHPDGGRSNTVKLKVK